jgi:hypothetical protein
MTAWAVWREQDGVQYALLHSLRVRDFVAYTQIPLVAHVPPERRLQLPADHLYLTQLWPTYEPVIWPPLGILTEQNLDRVAVGRDSPRFHPDERAATEGPAKRS